MKTCFSHWQELLFLLRHRLAFDPLRPIVIPYVPRYPFFFPSTQDYEDYCQDKADNWTKDAALNLPLHKSFREELIRSDMHSILQCPVMTCTKNLSSFEGPKRPKRPSSENRPSIRNY